MAVLGDLERALMDQLWDSGAALSAYELLERLPGGESRQLAPTTILTVLSRLEKKGLVVRERTARPHRYTAVAAREAHVAELMNEVLDAAPDRVAALARFIGSIPADEAEQLRRALGAPRT
ncbi:BlaI/MecI/CopY family transcriptional regulator [Homoserinibacter sp. YIM 151385]|uniref:BlaI/MecI/CopY family transcriptional regulator n=1 Tax=Homoserinibacter sp. YIM 151385 TaxID=2985506 RepID=UPI0022F0FDC6|nr:BlaI/MecI/CopY family transcriptional regulator [Homoserinibacter sp. YIM 151385]WBU38706.1 BlaI/MecI/CopY family transcriptional regulator [Homoserinibacter sp. YIM 151385]